MVSEERDRNRLNIHEIKSCHPTHELPSCLPTVFPQGLSTYLCVAFPHGLFSYLLTLPTYGLSSYQRIVFLHGLSPYTDCLPTNGFSFYQRTFCFTLLSWLAQNSTVTRSVTRLGHSHQGGTWVRCLATSRSRSRTACFFFFYRAVEKKKKEKKRKKKGEL